MAFTVLIRSLKCLEAYMRSQGYRTGTTWESEGRNKGKQKANRRPWAQGDGYLLLIRLYSRSVITLFFKFSWGFNSLSQKRKILFVIGNYNPRR